MKALFLTAGLGTRLKPYTLQYPKPLIPFLGLPLYLHAYDFLTQGGVNCSSLIFNVHHHADVLIDFITSQQHLLAPAKTQISDERAQIMDSGGAIQLLQEELGDETNFWVMNGDECLLASSQKDNYLQEIILKQKESQALATLLVTHNPLVGQGYGGAWCKENHQVVRFSKQPQAGLIGWHYVGVMLLSRRVFNYFGSDIKPSNILYDILTTAIQKGEKVQVVPQEISWFETGILEQFISNSQQLTQQPDSRMQQRLARYPRFSDIIIY